MAQNSVMQTPGLPRIAVLEDDPDCRQLILRTLGADFDCAAYASSRELFWVIETFAVDLVLLDIGLPGESGFEIAREIRRRSQVPIIFVTGYDKERHEECALNLGGDDFVGKPFRPSSLVARIRSVLRRNGMPPDAKPRPGSFNDFSLDPGSFEVICNKQPCGRKCGARLTEMEFNILSVLFRAGEGVVTRDDICRVIAGRDWDRMNRSIDVHITHLRQKLADAFGTTSLIQTLRGAGYRLTSNPWLCNRRQNDR